MIPENKMKEIELICDCLPNNYREIVAAALQAAYLTGKADGLQAAQNIYNKGSPL
jgi:hypothetical protein